jgi:hypothetical protein
VEGTNSHDFSREHLIVNQKYKGKLEGQKKDGPTNFVTWNRLKCPYLWQSRKKKLSSPCLLSEDLIFKI